MYTKFHVYSLLPDYRCDRLPVSLEKMSISLFLNPLITQIPWIMGHDTTAFCFSFSPSSFFLRLGALYRVDYMFLLLKFSSRFSYILVCLILRFITNMHRNYSHIRPLYKPADHFVWFQFTIATVDHQDPKFF